MNVHGSDSLTGRAHGLRIVWKFDQQTLQQESENEDGRGEENTDQDSRESSAWPSRTDFALLAGLFGRWGTARAAPRGRPFTFGQFDRVGTTRQQ